MKGYSKIKVSTTSSSPRSKSRSKDHPPPPLSPPPKDLPDPKSTPKEGDGGGEGERFGVVLSRTCSSASQRFSEQGSGHGRVQGVVRRAFSMRKQPSNSVTDGYWRIDDGNGDEGKDGGEDDDTVVRIRRKKGRIYRACKKIFRF